MNYEPSHEIRFLLTRYRAKIVEKTGVFWEILHWLVLVCTFGANRTFKSRFVTTLGPIIGIPKGMWPRDSTIRHELVHVRQFRTCGLGSAWVGIVPMFILYCLLPLPLGFAWFRWVFERRAYMENLRDSARYSPSLAVRSEIARIVDNLCGGPYGWTLIPLPCVKKYAKNWFVNQLARSK